MKWTKVGRPGAIGSRNKEIIHNYNKLYGDGGWRLIWDVHGRTFNREEVLLLYEDSYFEYFKQNPRELKWIANNFENVYDNNPSNVNSGIDYSIQEFGGNHFQDITIRRCLVRNGMWFNGEGLLEVRLSEPGVKWSPAKIPFHLIDLMPKKELKGWWEPGSLESWYQSARYLEVLNKPPIPDADIYFVTSNSGKVKSAQVALGDSVRFSQVSLDILEDKEDVAKISAHKARVAYSVLCRPVICDDSGFVIPSLDGYPGSKVGREIERRGIKDFITLAKDGPVDAYFSMVLSYFDENLEKPELFTSRVDGKLIGELRGDLDKPYIKSPIGQAFIINGQSKTLAEMNEEEYRANANSDRWKRLSDFLKGRN